MNIGHLLVTSLPGSSVPLKFSYSLFYVPRDRATFPDIRNGCGSIRGEHDWQGNILVVKQGKRKPAINMEREDAFLVDNIVSTYVVAFSHHDISVDSLCVAALITASWFNERECGPRMFFFRWERIGYINRPYSRPLL
jgi:hypothetical protein